MEPIKLQLEAGKYYRTRDGRKAFVAAIVPGQMSVWPAMGWIEASADTALEQVLWRLDGRDNDKTTLIAEWVEPKRIKGWMNVYEGERHGTTVSAPPIAHLGSVYAIREDAEIAASKYSLKRLACVELDVLEGQGLEGGR